VQSFVRFRTPDLRRNKLMFTLAIVAVFRLGSFIPAPLRQLWQRTAVFGTGNTSNTSGLYELVNLFSGGALLQLSIFALGIMPYITASIITQLLRVVIPRFETLYKEGQVWSGKADSVHPLPNYCSWSSTVNNFDCRCPIRRALRFKLACVLPYSEREWSPLSP
jgi:preprotein translocase subunit SecY